MRVPSPKTTIAAYVVAVAGTMLVTQIRLGLAPVVGNDMSLVAYLLVVMGSAALGGLVPGLFAGGLALFAGIAQIVGLERLSASPAEWVRVLLFATEAVVVSLLFWRLQKSRNELALQKASFERLALEDQLTGLSNRRSLVRDFTSLSALATREGATQTTLVSLDVDGLKATNDEYGHDAGDALIKAVADVLSEVCRASDKAYRVGGDEFVVLLPDTSPDQYVHWAERLDDARIRLRAAFDGAGMSFGAAHSPHDGRDLDSLMREADARMYAMKAEHRSGDKGLG